MNRCAHCEEFEDLVLGALPPRRASWLIAHAASCPACAAELADMQQQRELFLRRQRATAAMRPDLDGVFARIDVSRRQARRSWRQASATLAAGLVAAATLVAAWSGWNHVPQAMLEAGDDELQTSVQEDRVEPPPAKPCRPMTCSENSVLACEPVTCVLPELVAQSEPSTCNERPWTSFDLCVSEANAARP